MATTTWIIEVLDRNGDVCGWLGPDRGGGRRIENARWEADEFPSAHHAGLVSVRCRAAAEFTTRVRETAVAS